MRTLLAVLEPLRIEVTVTRFSENPEHVLPTIVAFISDYFPGSDFKVVAHGAELNVPSTFATFMAADVFVASASSMSLIATFLAGDSQKPVVVAAPHVYYNATGTISDQRYACALERQKGANSEA